MKEVSYIQRNPMAPRDAWDSLSIADKAAMMRVAVQNGITNLDDIRQKYNEFAEGGNIYAGGSYMPSEGIKKRISKWEGKAMTGAKDPLSGKFLKNNSFESEAAAFTQALPESIREQVLSNPELADNLFSYSYNVGAPRFKQRVVKALEDYYAGKGTAKKIADSMWASGDIKLRGLRNRRAEEKEGVLNALRIVPHTITEQPVSTAVVNPFILPAENTTFFPQVTPVEDNYVEVQEITPEQRRAEQVRNTFDAINNYNMMMDMLSVPNNHQHMYVPKNAPYVVKGLGGPIVEAAMNEYKKGGGIHIKHPGRLTALKKRTGKTEAELYNDGNLAHKKMVVFARNARKWHGDGGPLVNDAVANYYDGESEPTQQIVTHRPYYDRDGILLYNRTLPETVIVPDSQLSSAERNYRERQRQRNLPDYAKNKDKELTARQVAQSQREWENSFEKQALDYGQAIASGVGMGADMVSRLPIYSSLKGASTLSRAETPMDYVESGLWLAPIVSTVGKTAYDAAKPVVSKAANEAAIAWVLRNPEVPEGFAGMPSSNNYYVQSIPRNQSTISWEEAKNIKPFKSSLDWSPESWFGRYRPGGVYDAEDVAALSSHLPEYYAIEATAKKDGTWMRDANGKVQLMDPREWVIRQSKDYKNANLTGTKHYNGVSGDKVLNYNFDGPAWTDLEKSISSQFANSHTLFDKLPGRILQLDYPKGTKEYIVDAKGAYWNRMPEEAFLDYVPNLRYVDKVVEQAANHGYGVTKVNNIIEGNGQKVTDVIIHKGTPRKSVLGNNGNFDMSNTNIYKGILPFVFGEEYIRNK